MDLDFPWVTAHLNDQALILHSRHPLQTLSSAVVGGGCLTTRYVVNRHVHKGYCHPNAAEDLRTFARQVGITEPFVGLMTAASMRRACAATLREGMLGVAAVVTAGLSNPAAAGLSPPVAAGPGTVNLILLIDAHLAPQAAVNAIITATEAKTHVLLGRGVWTPEGYAATGTSTDAIVVACTGRGDALPYAGPVTSVGWLIGRCVRQVLEQALNWPA
jgi:adenosylcobinamide hydrolase